MVRKREKGMKDFFLEGRVVFHPSFYLHAKVIILIRVWKRRKYLCINKDSRNRGNSYIITHKHRQTTLCSTHTLWSSITDSFEGKSAVLPAECSQP